MQRQRIRHGCVIAVLVRVEPLAVVVRGMRLQKQEQVLRKALKCIISRHRQSKPETQSCNELHFARFITGGPSQILRLTEFS